MAKKTESVVEIKKIFIKSVVVELESDSPLIVHAWSEKAKREMLDKQMKKAAGPKRAKDPEQDYQDAFYRLPNGKPGFPVIAFKAAAVNAAIRFTSKILKGTEVRGFFRIQGVQSEQGELVEIIGEPRMREDMVRIAGGTADIRYRPEFVKWGVKLNILYNPDMISLEQLFNLFNMAGFGVGVGEWRPEKDGQYGMFHVKIG